MDIRPAPTAFFGAILFSSFIVTAGPADTIAPLNSAQQQILAAIERDFLPRGCCGTASLAGCLTGTPPCDHGRRMHRFAAWLAGRNMPYDSLMTQMMDRRDCLTATQRFAIDTAGCPAAGSRTAPATIVVYVSAYCPVCKRLLSELHTEVTAGSLKGKALLVAKPFGTTPIDKSLFAATSLGAFWPFVRALHNHGDQRPDEKLMRALADSLKVPLAKYDALCTAAQTSAFVERSRQEAVDNGVSITPTFFINGLRYRSYKDVRWVIDAAEMLGGGGKAASAK